MKQKSEKDPIKTDKKWNDVGHYLLYYIYKNRKVKI